MGWIVKLGKFMTFINFLGTARDPGKSAKLVIQKLLGKGTGVNHAYGNVKLSYLNFFHFLVLCSRITTTRMVITSISSTKTAPIAPPSAATFIPGAAG